MSNQDAVAAFDLDKWSLKHAVATQRINNALCCLLQLDGREHAIHL